MRTPIEALKEIRDRLTYFCLRTDGKYDPPWVTELVGIIDEAVTACHAVDNAAAMREALEAARDALDTIMSTSCHNLREITASRAYRKCREALALPLRQCDVGTVEEQSERMEKEICSKHYGCVRCPIHSAKYSDCSLKWAQMPYVQEGGAAQ